MYTRDMRAGHRQVHSRLRSLNKELFHARVLNPVANKCTAL